MTVVTDDSKDGLSLLNYPYFPVFFVPILFDAHFLYGLKSSVRPAAELISNLQYSSILCRFLLSFKVLTSYLPEEHCRISYLRAEV